MKKEEDLSEDEKDELIHYVFTHMHLHPRKRNEWEKDGDNNED